eukprot:gene17800-24175_t
MADELDDLDLELLQVAGRAKGSKKRRQDSDDDSDIFGSESDDEPRRKGPAKKLTKSSGGARRKGIQSESDYESDGDDDDLGDEDGYGSDLYIDEEDRRKLEAMTELEREMILADRAEERDKLRQRRALLKKAKSVAGEDRFEPRQGNRLSSRQKQSSRQTTDKDSAIRRIEAAHNRKEKVGKAKATVKKTKKRGGRVRDDSESDEDKGSDEDDFRPSDEEEEEEAAESEVGESTYAGGFASEDEEADEDASYEEAKTIQVVRSQLEAWYDKPIFGGDGLYGCLVRVAYGEANPSTGSSYMLMQIREVKETSRPYTFGPKGTPTKKYLVLVDGLGFEHTMAMMNVSNSEVDMPEWERFLRHIKRSENKGPQISMSTLKRQDIDAAKSKIDALAAYRWDSSKVKEALEKKRAKGQAPVNFAAEKQRLKRLLDGAQIMSNVEEVASIEQQLRDLDTLSMLEKAGDTRTLGMSHINKRNQALNFQNTITNVSNVPQGGGTVEGGVDIFSRRQTRPKVHVSELFRGKGWEEDAAEAMAVAGPGALADLLSPRAPHGALAAGVVSRRLGPHLLKLDPLELIKLLELDVKVDNLQEGNIAPTLPKRLLGPKWHHCLSRHTSDAMDLASKTVMTIADWKRRAGYM